MRAIHRFTILQSVIIMASAGGCVTEVDELGDVDELVVDESEGDELAPIDELTVLGPDGEPIAIAEDALCPGGCDDPPPCHYGPGVCLASGEPGGLGGICWYPEAFTGSICDNGFECTVAECVSGSCVTYSYSPEGSPCDDGDPATENDACDGAGTCSGEPTCPGGCDDPPPCHFGPGICQVWEAPWGTEASCWYPEVFAGTVCDDGFECTHSECIGGSCVPYWYDAAGTSCNDGDPCTSGDVCDGAGSCEGAPTFCGPVLPKPMPAPIE